MADYDTFVESLQELPEGQAVEIFVRDLAPGPRKYCYRKVRALVSAAADRYAGTLLVRFGRGQLHGQSFSIQILEELPYLPEKYR